MISSFWVYSADIGHKNHNCSITETVHMYGCFLLTERDAPVQGKHPCNKHHVAHHSLLFFSIVVRVVVGFFFPVSVSQSLSASVRVSVCKLNVDTVCMLSLCMQYVCVCPMLFTSNITHKQKMITP